MRRAWTFKLVQLGPGSASGLTGMAAIITVIDVTMVMRVTVA